MNAIQCLFLLPALALCGSYSGSVTLLDGTTIVGAVVKVGSDSTLTSSTGFVLSGTTGMILRSPNASSRKARWTLEDGRLQANFAGRDLSGRLRAANTSNGVSDAGFGTSMSSGAARATAAPETLSVYWKGKRLVVLPVSGDTSVSLRVDTAWSDDAGIPWNPRVPYASLWDSRDGKTYRTVTLGSRTWMAENLDYAGPLGSVGRCLDFSAGSCGPYGRLYTWAEALGLDTAFDSRFPTSISSRGICPEGWRVSGVADWAQIAPEDAASDTVRGGMPVHIGASRAGGLRLKARRGWTVAGGDSLGLRILRYGTLASRAPVPLVIRDYSQFRLAEANAIDSTRSWSRSIEDTTSVVGAFSITPKSASLSLRCVRD